MAIFISMLTYFGFTLIIGGGALRDASGVISEIQNQTFPFNFSCSFNHVSLLIVNLKTI